MTGDWIGKPLADIVRALRAGQLSSAALFDEARSRHGRFGAKLDAYRVWDESRAGEQAHAADAAFRAGADAGPLQGIPVSVKDLFGVDYLDTCAGSPRPLPADWSAEGPVIQAVRGQGAVLAGKTHMVEFAFGGLGTNPHWPVPRNPWDADVHRVPGGSSSGAGVSLIEGSALVALGTDTGGSVRVPASVTGTVGLKVTAGRWPLAGIVPLSPTFDTPGILTRCVADAALVFGEIDARCSGRAPGGTIAPAELPDLRIGVPERHFRERCGGDIASAVDGALAELERAGATLVAMDLQQTEEAYELFRHSSVVSSELRAFLEGSLPGWIDTLDPNVSLRMSTALGLDDPEILRRRERIAAIVAEADTTMRGFDILATPTVPVTAPAVADVVEPKAYAAANLTILSNTCIASMLGLCAITLPVALDRAGIPVGLQCMASGNAEKRLLAIALAIEDRLGTGPERLGTAPLAG